MWQQWRYRFQVSLEVESSRRSAGFQWLCGVAWWGVDLGIILYTWTSLHPPIPSSSMLYHTWTAESYFTHSHGDENNSPVTAWPPGNPFTLNMHHLSSVPTHTVNKDLYINIVADVVFSFQWPVYCKVHTLTSWIGHILSLVLYCYCHVQSCQSSALPINIPSIRWKYCVVKITIQTKCLIF